MSYQLMGWASQQTTGSPTRKSVLLALANCANHHTGLCCPSVEKICEETEYGSTAVKTALADLTEMGIIKRERRRREDGSLSTYVYSFPQSPGDQPQAAGVPSPETAGVSRNQEHIPNQETSVSKDLEPLSLTANELPVVRAREKPPMKVDRKVVTIGEARLAGMILDDWNILTDQSLSSDDWRRKIILRIREHPELGYAEHSRIIAAALQDPWWSGHPSPSVIYGNGAVFERALTLAQQGPAPPKTNGAMRYGRGVTPAQAIEAGRTWE